MQGDSATVIVRVLQFLWPPVFGASLWAGGQIVQLNVDKIMSAIGGVTATVKEIQIELKDMKQTDMELRLQSQRNADAIDNIRSNQRREN